MSAQEEDETFMRLAIEASRVAQHHRNMPFGAVLVRAGRVVHSACNNQVSQADSTGHAELVLIREASKTLGAQALIGATVYASGEPCAMCSGALFWAGVQRIVFAASQAAIARYLGPPILPIACRDVLAHASRSIEIVAGVLAAEAEDVLAGHIEHPPPGIDPIRP